MLYVGEGSRQAYALEPIPLLWTYTIGLLQSMLHLQIRGDLGGAGLPLYMNVKTIYLFGTIVI
jgi:hypothetical protein